MSGGTKPVFACFDVAGGEPEVLGLLRAKVRDAIVAGAAAVGYRVSGNSVPAQLKRINDEVAAFAPGFLAPPANIHLQVSTATILCRARATQIGRDLTVFAVSVTDRAGGAAFMVEGMRAGTKIEVVGENRTLTAQRGGFDDNFDPLAVHIYRFRQERGTAGAPMRGGVHDGTLV